MAKGAWRLFLEKMMKTFKSFIVPAFMAALLWGLSSTLPGFTALSPTVPERVPGAGVVSRRGVSAPDGVVHAPTDHYGAPLLDAAIEDTGVLLLDAAIEGTGVPLLNWMPK